MRETRELKKSFWFKEKPRIQGRYFGGKSKWIKIRDWEAQD